MDVAPSPAGSETPPLPSPERNAMSEVTALTLPFEGEPLTTLTWKGRPAWVGREIGRRLGYAGRGKRLVTRIRREWAEEFIDGTDYVVLTGDELAAFKAMLGPGTSGVPARASALLLLLEPGLHLVLTKTDMPIGRRLRRFLVDEVLPQLVRTGGYAPEPTVVECGVVVALHTPPASSLAERREARLAHQAGVRDRWVDYCDRKLKVATLHRTIDRYQGTVELPGEVAAALEITAAEIALGADLSAIKPDTERWVSPTEIAKRWGVSVQKVGRVISSLGLRGDERFSRRIVNKARGHDRIVFTFVYNAQGEALIDEALDGAGAPPKDAA